MPGCLPSHQVDSGCTASARAFALPLHCPCTAWFLAVLTEPPLTTLRYISSTTVHSSSSLAYNLNSQPSPFVEQALGDEPLHFVSSFMHLLLPNSHWTTGRTLLSPDSLSTIGEAVLSPDSLSTIGEAVLSPDRVSTIGEALLSPDSQLETN